MSVIGNVSGRSAVCVCGWWTERVSLCVKHEIQNYMINLFQFSKTGKRKNSELTHAKIENVIIYLVFIFFKLFVHVSRTHVLL